MFYVVLLAPSQVILGFLGAIIVFQLSKNGKMYRGLFFMSQYYQEELLSLKFGSGHFSADGPVNWLLGIFNMDPIMWFSESLSGIFVVSFIVLVSSFGANVILILSSLLDIDSSMIEAGKIDGANSFQRITKLIIPTISSTLKIVFLVSTVAAFQIYETILMLCPYEYTSSMTFRIYVLGFKLGKYGQSSAEAIILILIVMSLLIIQKKIQNEKRKVRHFILPKKDKSWRSLKWGPPRKDRFVQWLSSKGIIVNRTLSCMVDVDCFSKKAKFRLLYWRPLKLKNKIIIKNNFNFFHLFFCLFLFILCSLVVFRR